MVLQTDDPAQKNTLLVFKFLPLMIGYFSLSVPSGLSIYWFALINSSFSRWNCLLVSLLELRQLTLFGLWKRSRQLICDLNRVGNWSWIKKFLTKPGCNMLQLTAVRWWFQVYKQCTEYGPTSVVAQVRRCKTCRQRKC